MFSFQGTSLSFLSLRDSMKSLVSKVLQSISFLVEISGIEPLTSCLQGRRSPSWAKPPDLHLLFFKSGGPKWTRFSAEKPRRLQQSTGLLPRAGFRVHFLNSLPVSLPAYPICALPFFEVVGQNGLEPSTSRLSVVCSSQLSYWPILDFHILSHSTFTVPSKLNNVNPLNILFWP